MSSNHCTFQHSIYHKIGWLYILLSVSAIAGILLSVSANPTWIWLHYLTKPTAIALLAVWILLNVKPASIHYRNAIAFGLVFAVGGDICLMLPQDYFLAGLCCFLITHCAYIYALFCNDRAYRDMGGNDIDISETKKKGFCPKCMILRTIFTVVAVFALFAAITLLILNGLWNYLPDSMKVPVVVYAVTLAFMAGLAVNRAILYPLKKTPPSAQRAANIAALGGIFFVISDSLLAYSHFYIENPLSPLWILSTYYLSQWCFASSVRRRDQ
ncbi:lysoplasmalogenase [Xenorhabdus sp. M]|uniref:Lysoplasmalogenase n=1 Tax=Xenorhabdus szentirmaii TaxID=290112 RepID=A0AAW3Z0N7_9GAMM|nr:lysoplasmalogenase [Xenorhabdus sp. M]MBD2802644.1 lysoplasmalogenase [Xenorhabdus sp. M]